MRRRSWLCTSIRVPVDPEFEGFFIQHGNAHVERLYGKRRVSTWLKALGRLKMRRKRRAFLASKAAHSNGGSE